MTSKTSSFADPALRSRIEPKCANAIYGVADYLTVPVGMLLAAPFLLRHMGTTQFGIWMFAGAAVSGGGVVSGGFGDAVIKHVGDCRSRNDLSGVVYVVRNVISINLVLGSILAITLWYLSPYMARHIVHTDMVLQRICLQSLRIGSVLLLTKSIDSVFSSALRAFETYGATIRIAMCSRIAILTSAILLTKYGRNVIWIMAATVFISTLSMVAQALALRKKIGKFSPLPSWHPKTMSGVASFGIFSWLQAISGVTLGHVDRLFVGLLMGAPAVAYYGLCVQASQPIHGLVSSGMHFMFPHLSARYAISPISEIRRKVAFAIKINLALVSALSLPFIFCGRHVLTMWLGNAFGREPSQTFPIIACSFALLGANITAHYTLLAVGEVRTVTCLNILAGIAMLLLMALLVPKNGLQGAALARLVYGPITCLAYFQLLRILWHQKPRALLTDSSKCTVGAGSID